MTAVASEKSPMLFNEMWTEILPFAPEPQIVLVCKLFKNIFENQENSRKWLLNQLSQRAIPIENSLSVRKMASKVVIRHIFYRPESTRLGVNSYKKDFPLHGFAKLFKEETDLNLALVYNKIELENKPNFSHLKLHALAAAIRQFITKNSEEIKKIKSLNLMSRELTAVPEELELFTGLEEINLMGNNIDVITPSFGSTWTKLKKCDLGHNRIARIPENLGKNWPDLKHFSINNNQLTTLPHQWGSNWRQLDEINLSYNKITEFPSDLGSGWKDLQQFQICKNQLKTLPLDWQKRWSKLNYIDIANNQLSMDQKDGIQKMPIRVKFF